MLCFCSLFKFPTRDTMVYLKYLPREITMHIMSTQTSKSSARLQNLNNAQSNNGDGDWTYAHNLILIFWNLLHHVGRAS